MSEFRISVTTSFTGYHEENLDNRYGNQGGALHDDLPGAPTWVYGTLKKTKAHTKALATQFVADAIDNAKHPNKRMLGTRAGDVFLVEYNNGWRYSINGPNRSFCCMTLLSVGTFADAISRAINHIEQSFGGVIWEHGC